MKTFYTIIKLSPNTVAGDSLSIGLLVCRGKEYWLKISETRKNIAKKLLNDKEKSADFALKQLSAYLKKIKTEAVKEQLFSLEAFITRDYLDYLNVYANGILQFSKTSVLDDDFDNEKFIKLYSLLIEKFEVEQYSQLKQIRSNFYQKVNTGLITKVEDKIHTHISLNDHNLKSLYFNIDMDCIGKNGSFVGAKSLTMDHTVPTLKRNVSEYVTLIALLSQQYQKNLDSNRFYLIADEPPFKSEEHKFWQEMREVPAFTMIPSDEVEQVTEVVEKSGATRFLEEQV